MLQGKPFSLKTEARKRKPPHVLVSHVRTIFLEASKDMEPCERASTIKT